MNGIVILMMVAIGNAGQGEPVYAGTVVFGLIGLILAYLAFVRDEMDASLQLKLISIALLLLAVAATFWPMRPWPH